MKITLLTQTHLLQVVLFSDICTLTRIPLHDPLSIWGPEAGGESVAVNCHIQFYTINVFHVIHYTGFSLAFPRDVIIQD